MKPTPLAPRFARRMLPLAAIAALTVGAVLPSFYARQVLAERQGEAAAWASQLADRLAEHARARPALWAYDQPGLSRLVEPLVAPPISAAVRIDTVNRDRAYDGGRTITDAALGWAPVRSTAGTIARVRVSLSADAARRSARRVWLGAPVLGLLLGAALFFLPLFAVRRGDARNAELWKALSDANATLEARVEARTTELRRREAELQALGARLVAAQEEERARVSRDLHDDLGQVLTGLRLRLTAMQASAAGDLHGHLSAALGAVDDGVEAIRRLAHDLRPPALDGLGVADAIAGHARAWAAIAGPKLDLDLDVGPTEPPATVAEVLFRVCQEALTNVARHAEAESVRVELRAADDGWRLTVDDDGQGLSDGAEGSGLGLVGARERVEQAGGYLDLERAPAGGLRLLAWLPPSE